MPKQIKMNQEALRCLLCKKPKCSLQGCPVHTAVPEAMALYREGRLEEAGKLLFERNPLSAVTSRVCDWKQFCYGACILNVKQAPVKWYEIEQEVSGQYLDKVSLDEENTLLKGKRFAIVGAGPAGIVAAVWLRRSGGEVHLFDANPRIGGVLRYGIPPFRLDRALVDKYESLLASGGVVFHCSTEIGKELTVKDLSEQFDAVIIAAGAEKPSTLRIPGEERAIQALPYLKDSSAFSLGKKVIVIGGGNVAMDACRTAARNGAETWVYYRKTFENMPANPLEVEEAKEDGVQFRVFQAPVEIRDGGVVFRDCENVSDPQTGKIVTRIIDGTDHFVECDSLITAISEKPDFTLLQGSGAVFGEDGWPVLGEDGLLGGLDNVYIAGDFASGPKTVVEAVATARKSVDAILARCSK
ncbi:MAG: FAD-dependent oxidoreductase [Bacteroidales bacterium]|nr:FAD-dependent oxidoreductase [Bacteroidales bacterium]